MDGPVLVTGASGYIGGLLVDRLLDQGMQVRATSRNPARLERLRARGAEIVEADVMDRRSLAKALDGVRAAYYLVHSMGESISGTGFVDQDRYAAQNFALEGHHLEQIIYLGGLGRPSDDLSPHLRSRIEVGDVLLRGAAPATVLRAGIIIGNGSSSFQMLRYLVARLPIMICPRWVSTRCQPIAVDDVLAYLVSALGNENTYRRTCDIGGPEILTYREMMDRTAAIMDKRLTIITVPVLTPRLSAYWVDLVASVPSALAHALIEGLRNEVVVEDDLAALLMPIALTPFDRAVRNALTGAATEA